MIENIVVINTAVVSLGFFCCSKHEECRVIDSWLGLAVGLVEADEVKAEVTSGVLWLRGAVDGEAVAPDELPFLVIRQTRVKSYLRLK